MLNNNIENSSLQIYVPILSTPKAQKASYSVYLHAGTSRIAKDEHFCRLSSSRNHECLIRGTNIHADGYLRRFRDFS